ILGLDVVIDLLADVGVGTKAAAGEEMIALGGVVTLAEGYFRGNQPDVADVVLRAGGMATGQVDIEGRVDGGAPVAPIADVGRMALGVGGGEFASGIAGAGDKAGADLRTLDGEAELLDRGIRERHVFITHA